MREKLIEGELTNEVIAAFFEVYGELGFGFAERVHLMALEREMISRGLRPAREFGVGVEYKGEIICSYRLDMVVNEKLIVEVKSTELLPPTALRQLTNYLRCTDLEVGLLLHFGPEPKFYRRICSREAKQKRNKPVLSPDADPFFTD
jgi:GxxExxY protein